MSGFLGFMFSDLRPLPALWNIVPFPFFHLEFSITFQRSLPKTKNDRHPPNRREGLSTKKNRTKINSWMKHITQSSANDTPNAAFMVSQRAITTRNTRIRLPKV